jgi:hypothetical protein
MRWSGSGFASVRLPRRDEEIVDRASVARSCAIRYFVRVIIHSRVESVHLASNLLGDPSERDLFVYLPAGYEESGRRYPTAYLLHAYGNSAEQLITPATDGERWAPPLEDVLDPVFGRMGVPPMIVVIPDGNSRYGCGQRVDSPVTGNFEQYVLHDVVPSRTSSEKIPATTAAEHASVTRLRSGGSRKSWITTDPARATPRRVAACAVPRRG